MLSKRTFSAVLAPGGPRSSGSTDFQAQRPGDQILSRARCLPQRAFPFHSVPTLADSDSYGFKAAIPGPKGRKAQRFPIGVKAANTTSEARESDTGLPSNFAGRDSRGGMDSFARCRKVAGSFVLPAQVLCPESHGDRLRGDGHGEALTAQLSMREVGVSGAGSFFGVNSISRRTVALPGIGQASIAVAVKGSIPVDSASNAQGELTSFLASGPRKRAARTLQCGWRGGTLPVSLKRMENAIARLSLLGCPLSGRGWPFVANKLGKRHPFLASGHRKMGFGLLLNARSFHRSFAAVRLSLYTCSLLATDQKARIEAL